MSLSARSQREIRKYGSELYNITLDEKFWGLWSDESQYLKLLPEHAIDLQTGHIFRQKDGQSMVTSAPAPYQGVYLCSTQRFHNWADLLRTPPSEPDMYGRPIIAKFQVVAEGIPMVLGPSSETFIAPASYQLKQGDTLYMNKEKWLVNNVTHDTGLTLVAMTKQTTTGKP